MRLRYIALVQVSVSDSVDSLYALTIEIATRHACVVMYCALNRHNCPMIVHPHYLLVRVYVHFTNAANQFLILLHRFKVV